MRGSRIVYRWARLLVDEPEETLGERLALPPFIEHKRAEIESILKPLNSGK